MNWKPDKGEVEGSLWWLCWAYLGAGAWPNILEDPARLLNIVASLVNFA